MSSEASLTSGGEGASLALAGHPSNDGVTIRMTYGVDVLHQPASTPSFPPIGLVKLNLALSLVQLRLAWGDKRWW